MEAESKDQESAWKNLVEKAWIQNWSGPELRLKDRSAPFIYVKITSAISVRILKEEGQIENRALYSNCSNCQATSPKRAAVTICTPIAAPMTEDVDAESFTLNISRVNGSIAMDTEIVQKTDRQGEMELRFLEVVSPSVGGRSDLSGLPEVKIKRQLLPFVSSLGKLLCKLEAGGSVAKRSENPKCAEISSLAKRIWSFSFGTGGNFQSGFTS
ncbi:hypothetical protein U1Q18_013743 [Sarracenia purpurea var. burkii]